MFSKGAIHISKQTKNYYNMLNANSKIIYKLMLITE